jgi:hypothetical protein
MFIFHKEFYPFCIFENCVVQCCCKYNAKDVAYLFFSYAGAILRKFEHDDENAGFFANL